MPLTSIGGPATVDPAALQQAARDAYLRTVTTAPAPANSPSPLANIGINGPATVDPSAIGRPATATRQPILSDAPTINPDGSIGYPYQPGVDPLYDAWLAQYHGQVATDQSDAALKQQQAQQQYQGILAGIGVSADANRHNLQTSMLQRGVYQSGETGLRSADLEADVLRQQTTAQQNQANASGGVASDLQRAIAALDLQNVSQIGNAIDRQTAKKIALDAAARGESQQAPQSAQAPAPAAAPAPVAAQVAPAANVQYSPTPLAHGTTGGISGGVKIAKAPAPPKAAAVPSTRTNYGQTQTGRY